jgi:hypothetical protein
LIVNDALIPIAAKGKVMPGKEVWGTEHAELIGEFYRCVRENEHFPIDVEEGGKVIRLILSMYASNGERIEILN